jgi:hypothetical protein
VRIAALGALAFAIAACGGGSDGETTTAAGPPPGRGAYIARADAFCAQKAADPEVAKSLERLEKTTARDPDFRSKLTAHFRLVLRLAESAAAGFKAIEPPDSDRARIAEFIAANEGATERLRDVISALESGEDPEDELEAYGHALAVAERLGAAYGFEVCARASPD